MPIHPETFTRSASPRPSSGCGKTLVFSGVLTYFFIMKLAATSVRRRIVASDEYFVDAVRHAS